MLDSVAQILLGALAIVLMIGAMLGIALLGILTVDTIRDVWKGWK